MIFVLFLLFQFANAQELALVRKDGKFGYTSKSGEFAIEPKYKTAKFFLNDRLTPKKTENGVLLLKVELW